jgi:hypothetical protein
MKKVVANTEVLLVPTAVEAKVDAVICVCCFLPAGNTEYAGSVEEFMTSVAGPATDLTVSTTHRKC